MKHTASLITSWFLVCSYLATAQGKPQTDTFVLDGKIVGQPDGYVHLKYTNKNSEYIDDSCSLKNGVFHFKGQITEPVHAYFSGRINSRNDADPNATDLFLEPGNMQAIFELDNLKHGQILGSRTQSEYEALTKENEKVEKKWKPVIDNMMGSRNKHEFAKADSIRNYQLPGYFTDRNQTSFNFINSHADSYVTPYLLGYLKLHLPLDSVKMFYTQFSPRIQQSKYGKELMDFIYKTENVAIGKPAPDFKEKDISGNPVSLKDFGGKYVLLEFWASWCAPCRAENPSLITVFNQYKNKKFTVLGISLDATKDAWLKAIQQDKLPWTNICDFKELRGNIINQYNLVGKGIPANFLIDPNGKIIAMDLQADELKKKLAGLLAKN